LIIDTWQLCSEKGSLQSAFYQLNSHLFWFVIVQLPSSIISTLSQRTLQTKNPQSSPTRTAPLAPPPRKPHPYRHFISLLMSFKLIGVVLKITPFLKIVYQKRKERSVKRRVVPPTDKPRMCRFGADCWSTKWEWMVWLSQSLREQKTHR